MTFPDDVEKPKASLSYKIFHAAPETSGCMLMPCFLLLGLGGAMSMGLSFEQSLMFAGAGGLLGFTLVASLWKRIQRLFQEGYVALPGRVQRDARRFGVWARQHNCRLLPCEESKDFVSIEAGRESVRALPGAGLAERLAEEKRLDALSWSVFLDVEPRPKGYALRVRFHMPDAWQELLAPCVDREEALLGDWLSCSPFAGEEALPIRPFVWHFLRNRKDDEPALSTDEVLLRSHGRKLFEWDCENAYWSHDKSILSLCQEIPLTSLEEKLAFYKTLTLRLLQTLSHSHLPFLDQILSELAALSWPNRLFYLREYEGDAKELLEQERCAIIHHFWTLLYREHGYEKEVEAAFLQWLGSPSVKEVRPFLGTLLPTLRDGVVLPLLEQFLGGSWRDVLETQPQPLLRPTGLPGSHSSYRVREDHQFIFTSFTVCLDVLAEYWPLKRFLALCSALSKPPVEGSSSSGRELSARKLRLYALERWYLRACETLLPQLVQWLEEEDELFKYEVLDSIRILAIRSETIEEAVVAQLSFEVRCVPQKQLPIRIAAITALGVIGTERAIEVLQQGIWHWDAIAQKIAIDAAKQALKVLYATHQPHKLSATLKGALSTVGEDTTEGGLSLPFFGDARGQVSLVGPEDGKAERSSDDNT